jgi:hypothetical protein
MRDLGEPDYYKRSIDSMTFHTSRCTPTNVSPGESMLLHLWFNSPSTQLISQAQQVILCLMKKQNNNN